MNPLTLLLLLATTADEQTWDFQQPSDLAAFTAPAGSQVVAEAGRPENQAYLIRATAPHHTRLVLRGSEATPDFVATVRARVLAFTGAPPVVYLYGRVADSGFRFASLGGDRLSLTAYYGAARPAVGAGAARVAGGPGAWVWLKLACRGDEMYAKAWRDGAKEPRWQLTGTAEGLRDGPCAVGVWTSPRTPSTADVLIDDVRFQPLPPGEAAALGLAVARHEPFDQQAVPPAGGPWETPAWVGVANAGLALVFDRRTGALAHLVDRVTGRDYVLPTSPPELFEIGLTRPAEGASETVTAADFERVEATRDARGVTLTWAGHPTLALTPSVRAELGPDQLVHLRFTLANATPWAVASVDFPRFTMPAQLGGNPSADALVLPWADGAILPQPGTASQTREALYPESSSFQFTARYDDGGGLYYSVADAAGHCKRWGLAVQADRSVRLGLDHLRPEVVGAPGDLPYDLVFTTFRGDWRAAAAIYRAWAIQQPWCRTRLVDRADVPAFLKAGSGVLITGLQNQQGFNPARYGPRLERLPAELAEYRRRTGLAHLIFVPYGWEGRGTWAGIHYLPAVPSNAVWQEVSRALAAQGDRLAFLLSGYWWVTKRQASSNGPAFDDTAEAAQRAAMLVTGRDGRPFEANAYAAPTGPAGWRGLSVKLCHGSREAQATLLEQFLGAAALGVPLVSFDQEIGGGQREPCYHPDHGHPPGYGDWMWTSFRDLCTEILRRGRAQQPELGLFIENVSELAIPYLATYWSRQFAEIDYGAAGARGVGLFSYLYHDYVTAIGAACVQGQGQQGTRPDAWLRVRVLANNLTRGLIPGPFLTDVPLEPTTDWHRPVAQAFASYAQPYARFPEYLLLGETCPPPAVASEESETWFLRADAAGDVVRPDGSRLRRVPLRLPAVTAGSFRAADGSVGTVLVNATGDPRTAQVTLRPTTAAASLYRADRTQVDTWRGGERVWPVELEPLGVRFLVER